MLIFLKIVFVLNKDTSKGVCLTELLITATGQREKISKFIPRQWIYNCPRSRKVNRKGFMRLSDRQGQKDKKGKK